MRFALAAIGRDRPGIVAAMTRNLVDHGLNVEDSQMTILGGHFTMMLVVAGPDELDAGALRSDLEGTAQELALEAFSLTEVADLDAGEPAEPSHIVTVYGADHPGIVHAVAAALAERGVNITDLNTRLVGGEGEADLYAMLLEVALPRGLGADELREALEAVRSDQGVEVTVRELEQDAL